MINIEEANCLVKWIKEWKITYQDNPSLEECYVWFEWKFNNKYLSKDDKNHIKDILDLNSDL
tara:strand:- start:3718 stop:3903 length:186 start_codon:yes stop_codon:yes gene_type:complete